MQHACGAEDHSQRKLYMNETPRMSHADGGDQVVTNNPIREKKIAFFLLLTFQSMLFSE